MALRDEGQAWTLNDDLCCQGRTVNDAFVETATGFFRCKRCRTIFGEDEEPYMPPQCTLKAGCDFWFWIEPLRQIEEDTP